MAERKFRIIGNAAQELQDQAIGSAEAAAEQIETAANEIAEYARSAAERLEDWSKDSFKSARSAVEEQPVLWSAVSIGIVALAGLAATWLASRNRPPRRRARPAPAQLRARRTRRVAKTIRAKKPRQASSAEAG